MRVRDLMVKDVGTCMPDTDVGTVAKVMWDRDCGAIPVLNQAHEVVGMITDRDICIALATRSQQASALRAGDVMSGRVCACSPEQSLEIAMETMRQEKVRRLPVVDSLGTVQGILSMSDLVMQAQPAVGSVKTAALTCDAVVETLKAISKPRNRDGRESIEAAIPPAALGY